MDKVQKILNEIMVRKLCTMDEHMAFYNDKAKDDYRFLSETEELIKALQEEPVSEELEKVSKEWLASQLDKSYADYGEAKMMELTRFDGYAMLDAIEFGAQWKKEYLMANGVDGIVHHFEKEVASVHYNDPAGGSMAYYFTSTKELSVGDKVKIIVIKE